MSHSMSSSSKEGAKYEVCFLQAGDSPEKSTELLKLAFDTMDKNQLDPMWITPEDCLKITRREPKLFVIDSFEGEAFEHLKGLNCRIMGPLCILYCLQYNDVLPKRSYPLYSVSMRRLTISCSNIPANQREEISRKVELMGGFFSKDLMKSVTHLVVGEVGSQKYKVAASFNLPIMTPEWVTDVWEIGQYKQMHGSDSYYHRYKCPVFKGLIITVSQLTIDERQAVKTLVEENGGVYSGALKAHETTHLVLNEPSGEKYRFAKNWKVICVKLDWIHESIKAGFCQDEAFYQLDESSQAEPKRSTPKKDLTSIDLPLVDCSAIAGHTAVSHLDETMKSDVTFLDSARKNSFIAIDQFNLADLPKDGEFLDGCKIYLTGFSAPHMAKLMKIVNAGGGTRFSKYSDSITHVICGGLADEFLKSFKSSSVKPFIVTYSWLLECCKNARPVDEKPFLLVDGNTLSPEKTEMPETKKENAACGFQTSSQSRKTDSSTHQILTSSQMSKLDDLPVENITDILKQYVKVEHNNGEVKPDSLQAECSPNSAQTNVNLRPTDSDAVASKSDFQSEAQRPATNGGLTEQNSTQNDVEETDDANEKDEVTLLFKGLKFIIVGFGEKDTDILSAIIENHSGQVLMDGHDSGAIAIVPLIWKKFHIDVSVIVTNCWLQKCVEESRIFDFDENDLFRPFELRADVKPLQSFVISFSQYVGTERDCLQHLAESLGAVCQDYFVRKANATKGILANTHLVVSIPEGSKYEASKKWKIPAVTKKWVIQAAKTGVAPDVEGYLVDDFPDPPIGVKEKDEPVDSTEKKGLTSAKDTVQNEGTTTFGHCSFSELSNGQNLQKQESSPSDYPDKKTVSKNISPEFSKNLPSKSASTPKVQHNRVAELRNESLNQSPLHAKPENSLNASLGLNHSADFKFSVSGVLKDLDGSTSRRSSTSLPVEDMFGRNLVCALERLDEKSMSELSLNGKLSVRETEEPEKPAVLRGVILYVSKKLNNIQTELNEIVVSLGGDCIMSYDKSCTHFVFVGKTNDITKEFREARSHGKKIVCPDWVYACKESNSHVSEEAYPHTYKASMSLSQQISITKVASEFEASRPESTKAKLEIESKTLKNSPKIANTSASTSALNSSANGVDFNKLNALLVAAKSAKKRLSKKRAGSASSSPVRDMSPIQKQQRHLSDVGPKPSKTDDVATDEMPDTCSSQLSQAYPILWDDPTGRLEREKINAKTSAENRKKVNLTDPGKPELPAFDLDLDCSPAAPAAVPVKKFMFTNISEKLKAEYIENIQKLGGEVSDENISHTSATHLIVMKPLKSWKFLSSVASGKWVIHPSYVTESIDQNRFLDEEDFEWGGPKTDEFAQHLSALDVPLAKCPRRWRLKIQQEHQMTGAFESWKVVFHADDKNKLTNFSNILESGGAEIIDASEVEHNLERITHVFVDYKKKNALSKIDFSCYAAHNIKCLKPEYLAFYLIDDPPPSVENFVFVDSKVTGSEPSTSRKRDISTASSVSSRQSKRTKLK